MTDVRANVFRSPFVRGGLAYSLLGAALLLSTSALKAEERVSDFTAEPCCQLCPAALNPAAYNTKYLDFFTTLVEADNDWLFRTENDLRTEFGPSPYGYEQLGRLRDLLKAKGTELVIVYQPTRGLVHPDKLRPEDRKHFDYERARANYSAALKKFRDQGIWVPDLTPLLAEKSEQPYFFRGDHHWTPYGAERTALQVAETVKQIPAFADVPRKAYESRIAGLLGKRGTLHKAAGNICGTSYADEYVERFVTEPVGEEVSSDDLFGDQSDPQIVLVGTSNSGEAYNFPGFLQEHLGADLLNVSFAGGGYDGSLMQYLSSEEFHTAPPKVLIWEFETHYDLAQEKFYRQTIALLENGCEGRETVALSNSVPVRVGMNEVLVNGKHKQLQDIRGGDYLVDVRFSDPSVHELRAVIWYMTGRREQFKADQSSAVQDGGRFVFNLRNAADWGDLTFLSLEVQSPEVMPETPLTVEAKLCKRGTLGQLTAHAD
ncbi:alginate O-acetyltransferase [Pseudomonas borbori]